MAIENPRSGTMHDAARDVVSRTDLSPTEQADLIRMINDAALRRRRHGTTTDAMTRKILERAR